MGSLHEARALLPLPFEEWENTKETLHRYCQIVGKVRMEYSPYRNHWWHVTLYVTRFSDKRVSLPEGTDPVTRDAYSHEVISFGFWPGDRNVREPTFYSYTAPEPESLTEQPLRPQAASWTPEGGTALLAYEEVRNSGSPRETLLEFLQSAYEAGAKTASWDTEEFRTGAG